MIERRPVTLVQRDGVYVPSTGAGVITESAQKVLRNTYMLLSMTLLFSAAMAGVAVAIGLPPIGGHVHSLITFAGMMGLLLWVNATRNSSTGIIATFVFTGFTGFMLGPILTAYMKFIPNGGSLIMMSLGGTGAIFLALSAVALGTKKDFSFMGKFLFAGMIAVMVASIGALIASAFGVVITGVMLAVSVVAMLIFSAAILFDTSRIIHGGETNYISATVALYLDIYNIFIALLNITGILGRDE